MNYKMLIGNKFFERCITDLLYADLEEGNVDFLKIAYKKIGISNNQIMKMRKKYPKITSKAENVVYEDILNIILEELLQKRNENLYIDLMDFYLKRFPYIKERFEGCRNDLDGWHRLYSDTYEMEKYNLSDFMNRTFVILYCITYGQMEQVKDYLEQGVYEHRKHYRNAGYSFYDRKNNMIDPRKSLEEHYCIKHIKNTEMFQDYKDCLIDELAGYLEMSTWGFNMSCLFEMVLNYIFAMKIEETPNVVHYLNQEVEGVNAICRKYQMNQHLLFMENEHVYKKIFYDIFDQMCIEKLYYQDTDLVEEEKNRTVLGNKLYEWNFDSPDVFLREIVLRFLFECHLMGEKKLFDEYYKSFSIDSSQTDTEKIRKENSCLKDELQRCKRKLQQYADADAERKKQQNKEAKKENRQYNEKIASLEKQLDEQKKALENQARTMEDMQEYVALVESANNIEPDSEGVDISKFYQYRILFVGGRQETVTRLKAVFSTAGFVTNETMQVPQKTDLIVLMAENMNHALYYKYIGHAREKGIKVIYCNGTNIETITNQVACNL